MSSAVVSTTAAQGRPFLFDADAEPEVGLHVAHEHVASPTLRKSRRVGQPLDWRDEDDSRHPSLQSTIKKSALAVVPASRLEIRPAPEMAPTGIAELDALTGGLLRGCLTEICGSASSGRTTVLLSALAAATRRGEYCALIDASDALDPLSAVAAGVDLDRLLWVRCGEDSLQKKHSPQRHPSTALRAGSGTEKQKENENGCPILAAPFAARVGISSEHRLEQLLRATDLLLESGGFGLIVLDLADVPQQAARRIPLTTWFRFRRAVEYKPTILLAIEQQPIAGSCSSLLLQLHPSTQCSALSTRFKQSAQNCVPSHVQLLTGLAINAELIRSRWKRKPAGSVIVETKTAWTG